MKKLFLIFGIMNAWGNSYTWVGTSADWGVATNWTPSGPPIASDTAIFTTAAPPFQPDLNASPYSIGTIQFEAASPTTISGIGASLLTFSVVSGNASIIATTTGNTISAPMSLSSNLATTVSANLTLTLTGMISGTSSFTAGGAGATVLNNAASTYSGGTTVSSGTLQVFSDGSLGLNTAPVTISSGIFQAAPGMATTNASRPFSLSGTATIDPNGNIFTIPGVISGASLTVHANGGVGTLVLQGTNLYTGGTTVSSGKLQISADANLGPSGTLSLLGGTTLEVAGASLNLGSPSGREMVLTGSTTVDTNGNPAQITSVISGTGSLAVASTLAGGVLTLTGANTYQGQTTIAAGATLLGNTTSLPGNIALTGDLIFNQTTAGTYTHVLSGAGTLTVQGGGPLTISGSSPGFTGPTTVTASQLIINGSLANSSLAAIDAASVLSGSGTVGAVANGGTILPGTSGDGTLSVNGALTFNPGSFFREQITPSSNGLIQVSGTATLTNGSLIVDPVVGSGFFGLTKTYTILTGASVVSPFSSLSVTDPNFSADPAYSATDVQLLITVLRPFLDFPCSNANTCSVAHNIDALNVEGAIGPAMTSVIDALAGQSDAVVNDALDQMHPAAMSAFAELQAELGGQMLSLFHRTPSLRCSCSGSNRLWVEPFGNWLKEKKQGMEIGFQATTRGVAFGYDHQFLDCWTLGVGGAWNTTDLKWSLKRGYSYVDGLYGSLYTDLVLSNFYVGGSVYAGKDWYHTSRCIHFTTIDLQAVSDTDGFDMGGQLTAAYFFGTPSCLLYPYGTVDYLYLQNASFSESGANTLDLHVNQYTNSTLRAEAGGAWRFIDRNRDETICLSPLIAMGYVLELPLHRDHYESTFAGQSIPFTTKGWDMAWQLLNLRFGLAITYRCLTLDSQYIADISPEGDSPFFNQRANFRFSLNF